ncbi:sigma 54-interacting transcriptional regulator [Wukongibacter baidiensis]|uniref:sigma-54 interaction domain-containing protein n=1 Tax=Wukongibacter baidiensis TaxID=1723361 RepID=UPI003D7F4E92
MSLYDIFCFLDEDNVLNDVEFRDEYYSETIKIYWKMKIGLPIEKIINIDLNKTSGRLEFEGKLYEYVTIKNRLGNGAILCLSNDLYKSKIYEAAMDNLSEGIQIFDKNGHLIHYNKKCEELESLQRENIIGKHLLEIYEVDEEYSTVINTIKTKTPVVNRCDIFKNNKGDKLYSINSGYPLYVGNEFAGAIGTVYDMSILEEIMEKINRINSFLKEEKQNELLNDKKAYSKAKYYNFDDLIGEAEAFKKVVRLANKVALNESSVLISGETGTGKEMFAQSIHSASKRKDKEFIAVNCAAIPSNLIEGILFGTVKGAFTGSVDREGLFEQAQGGTLFLDEINSMDLNTQSKLLRVLQERKFRRVGGLKDIECDVRIISALNEDPSKAIENSRLRNDLYYRLSTVSMELPPLRERKEDIPILAEYFINKLSKMYFKNITKVSKEVLIIFREYDWPGNIREFSHILEYCCNIVDDGIIKREHLPQKLIMTNENDGDRGGRKKNLRQKSLKKILNEYEKKILENLLEENDFNITKVAKILGIKRQSLQHRLKKCNIQCKKN